MTDPKNLIHAQIERAERHIVELQDQIEHVRAEFGNLEKDLRQRQREYTDVKDAWLLTLAAVESAEWVEETLSEPRR